MYNPPYPVWSIWQNCGWLERFVLVLLGGLIIYSLCFALKTIAQLCTLKSLSHIDILRKRWTWIAQSTKALFYLFGFVLFFVLQYVGTTFGDGGPGWASHQMLDNFVLACAFAASAFLGFLFLHAIQWFISVKISATMDALHRRESSQHADD
jgi:hypothetical protein